MQRLLVSRMTHAVKLYANGGPEKLIFENIELPELQSTEARVRHMAIGLNFIDIYIRNGLYPTPLPCVLGSEASGIVEAVGKDVDYIQVGDRVAYGTGPLGAYSQVRNIPAEFLLKLPDQISFDQGACMMLKGMTVEYLITRTFKVQAGQTVLWHAAAGGVGLIACQWLRAIGASVIATAGTDEKCAMLRDSADYVINYTSDDFVQRVKDITKGAGVPVVYDSVGAHTFTRSLQCLQPRGLLVSFGNSSGPVTGVDLSMLTAKSLYVTRPSLKTYCSTRGELEETAKNVFDMVLAGKITFELSHRYPLENAAQAHSDLEYRKTTGAIILQP